MPRTLPDDHPMKAKLASFGRDRTTGRFHRLPVEGEMLAERPHLKPEFDRVDELTEEEMLIEYGYTQVTEDGYLIRMKGDRPVDRFKIYSADDFLHDRWDPATARWIPVKHRVTVVPSKDVGMPPTLKPDYLWPREAIRMIYGHALKNRAHFNDEPTVEA